MWKFFIRFFFFRNRSRNWFTIQSFITCEWQQSAEPSRRRAPCRFVSFFGFLMNSWRIFRTFDGDWVEVVVVEIKELNIIEDFVGNIFWNGWSDTFRRRHRWSVASDNRQIAFRMHHYVPNRVTSLGVWLSVLIIWTCVKTETLFDRVWIRQSADGRTRFQCVQISLVNGVSSFYDEIIPTVDRLVDFFFADGVSRDSGWSQARVGVLRWDFLLEEFSFPDFFNHFSHTWMQWKCETERDGLKGFAENYQQSFCLFPPTCVVQWCNQHENKW